MAAQVHYDIVRKHFSSKVGRLPEQRELKSLTQFACWQAEKQASPESLLWTLVDHCWKMHWVIPNYDVLSTIVSDSYNQFESVAVEKTKAKDI